MSLFKERAASPRKVVALESTVLSLNKQLEQAHQMLSTAQGTVERASLTAEERMELQTLKDSNEALSEEVKNLKSDLKRVRTENSRLKKRLEVPPDVPQESD